MNKDKMVKIQSIKLSNYKFFYGDDDKNNKFNLNGNNALIYGENGSGKSSIYKALELLTKDKIEKGYFDKEANIFVPSSLEYDLTDVAVKFSFTNDTEIIFDKDKENIDLFSNYPFLDKLHIFKPMLDYKKLLKLHYVKNETPKLNIYEVLEELLKNYPLKDSKKLFEIEGDEELDNLSDVLNQELKEPINHFIKYFEADFEINSFEVKFIREAGAFVPSVNMSILFRDNKIENYHSFLNEARLSALAIAIYFASIKKLFETINNDCIKILVLDDLLISFDMSHRLKLLTILKEEFSDFQILFFTHDKELFEIYKDKLDWEKYEIYYDDSDEIPKALIKKSSSYIEKARLFYLSKDYDISASFLRKEFESILKKVLPKQISVDDSKIKLETLIDMAISFSYGEEKQLLEDLNRDKKHILNPASHDDNRSIYAEELKNTIKSIEKISEWNPKIKNILPQYSNMKFSFKDTDNITNNYIFNLNENLYLYEKDGKPELSECDCNCLYAYFGDNDKKFEHFKYESSYKSILDLYTSILKFKNLPIENDYKTFFKYKNNKGKWKNLSELLKT